MLTPEQIAAMKAAVNANQAVNSWSYAGQLMSMLAAAVAEVERLQAEHERLAEQASWMRKALFVMPRWKCSYCGNFAGHSGNHPCKNCGKRHGWSGSFAWPDDSQFCKDWIEREEERLTEKYGHDPRAVATRQPPSFVRLETEIFHKEPTT